MKLIREQKEIPIVVEMTRKEAEILYAVLSQMPGGQIEQAYAVNGTDYVHEMGNVDPISVVDFFSTLLSEGLR